jgi:hypothetical protein
VFNYLPCSLLVACCLAGPSGAGGKPAAAAGAPGSSGKVEVVVLDDSSEDEGPKRPARAARAPAPGKVPLPGSGVPPGSPSLAERCMCFDVFCSSILPVRRLCSTTAQGIEWT